MKTFYLALLSVLIAILPFTAEATEHTVTINLQNSTNVPYHIIDYQTNGGGDFLNQPSVIPPKIRNKKINIVLNNSGNHVSFEVIPADETACGSDPKMPTPCSKYEFWVMPEDYIGFSFWAGTRQLGMADWGQKDHLYVYVDFLSRSSEDHSFMSRMEGDQVVMSKIN